LSYKGQGFLEYRFIIESNLMTLRTSVRDENVKQLNDKLYHFISQDFRKSDFKNQEKLLIADSRFQKAIQEARERLDPDAKPFIKISGPPSLSSEDRRVGEEAIRVLEKTYMPNGWFDYVCKYIVSDDGVIDADVEPQLHIEADQIKGDELYVRFRKGMTSKEYRSAWKALKIFLEKSPTEYDTTEESEPAKVYFAYQRGVKPSAIAKEFFPSEYRRDPIATRDRIKKIIKRYDAKK